MAVQNDKVKDLLEQAREGTKEVFTSENYINYLNTMAKFYDYSAGNCVLIWLQRPTATRVAGYVAWQKKFKRHVKEGEKGIKIIGASNKSVVVEEEAKDDNGFLITDSAGNPIVDTVIKKYTKFFPVYVYDVEQTDGEPLPEFPIVSDINGNVENYDNVLATIKSVSPYPIVFEEFEDKDTKGYCSYDQKKIAIQQGMSEAQIIKTAIHEVAHARLHNTSPSFEVVVDRRTKEIEAESTAFVVSSFLGIDTSEYSFPYLASWSKDKELPELQSSMETIHDQATLLIDEITKKLKELEKVNVKASDKHEPEFESPQRAAKLGDVYFSIENIAEGRYKYSIYNSKYQEIGGGNFRDPTSTMDNILINIVTDYKKDNNILANVQIYDYNELQEQIKQSNVNNHDMGMSL